MSPLAILNRENLKYKKHLKLQFGQYFQVHKNETSHNSEKASMQGAICLGPSGNQQGVYQFISLKKGNKITRYSWDEIPMPDTVIDQVNKLGENQLGYFIFTNHRSRQIGEVDLTGVDGEINEAPLRIQNVENHDI